MNMAMFNKGLWIDSYWDWQFAYGSNATPIVTLAKTAGCTCIYAGSVANIGSGFYGQAFLNDLLPKAHAAGIAVFPAISPDLLSANLSTYESLTVSVANYQTPSGDKADGIIIDVEVNLTPDTNFIAFSSAIRTTLGVNYPLAVTVLNPQTVDNIAPWATYPQTYIDCAAYYNIVLPQLYWVKMMTYGTYPPTPANIALWVQESVAAINTLTPGFPIAPIGQMWTYNGVDPTPAQVAAFINKCISLGVPYSMFHLHDQPPNGATGGALNVFGAVGDVPRVLPSARRLASIRNLQAGSG